jgi:hypothetical protein
MSMYFQKLSRHLIILGFAAGLSAFSTSSFAQDPDNTDGWGNDNQENKEDAPEKPEASETTAPAGDGDRYAVLTAPIGRVKGPKRTVAVGKFATIGSFSEEYGD